MRIKLNNIKQDNIILFDIEYDQNSLVQIAFLILCKIEPNIFELTKSFNVYIKQSHYLNNFFTRYTNITHRYLCDNGVDFPVAKAMVNEVVLNLDLNNTLIVSHGIKNDLKVLKENDIDLYKINNRYCTYDNAKKLLKRTKSLTLKDVAAEGCYYMFNEHNAYADVWGTLYAFSHLNKLEQKEN